MKLRLEQLEPRDTPTGVTPTDPSTLPFDGPKGMGLDGEPSSLPFPDPQPGFHLPMLFQIIKAVQSATPPGGSP